jgi:hypothetical protein
MSASHSLGTRSTLFICLYFLIISTLSSSPISIEAAPAPGSYSTSSSNSPSSFPNSRLILKSPHSSIPQAATSSIPNHELFNRRLPSTVSSAGQACNPHVTDRPDLCFVDSNCDGIDGDPTTAIFVDAANGNDSWPGTLVNMIYLFIIFHLYELRVIGYFLFILDLFNPSLDVLEFSILLFIHLNCRTFQSAVFPWVTLWLHPNRRASSWLRATTS